MSRAGRTWITYTHLMRWIAVHQDVRHEVRPETPEADEELLRIFVQQLATGMVDFKAVTDATGISLKHFQHHLRYLSRWGATRRVLLAAGGHFQLLQKLKAQEDQGLLDGLTLSGTLVAQRQQLAAHLQHQEGQSNQDTGSGWLPPDRQTRRTPRLYGPQDLAWIYSDNEVEFAEGLHPAVARSLIARYLPGIGAVADPMAGSGTIARIATYLGHTAWASDRYPAHPFIREVNLLNEDLLDVLETTARPTADLLFLHPPLPTTLDLIADGFEQSDDGYAKWLTVILGNTLNALRGGGFLILILPLQVSPQLLIQIEDVLVEGLNNEFLVEEMGILARHLAVARSGREGWHLLVAQSPVIPDCEKQVLQENCP